MDNIKSTIQYFIAHSDLKGEKGDTGSQGLQGLKGDRGIQGEQGLQGIQGDRGIQGEQGLQGIQGDRGIQGEQGLQGIQGDKGADGADGQDGADAVLPFDLWKGTLAEYNALTTAEKDDQNVIHCIFEE